MSMVESACAFPSGWLVAYVIEARIFTRFRHVKLVSDTKRMSVFWMLRNTSTSLMLGVSPFAFNAVYCMRELFYQFFEYGGKEIPECAHMFNFFWTRLLRTVLKALALF